MTSKSDLKPIFISTLAKGLKPCDNYCVALALTGGDQWD